MTIKQFSSFFSGFGVWTSFRSWKGVGLRHRRSVKEQGHRVGKVTPRRIGGRLILSYTCRNSRRIEKQLWFTACQLNTNIVNSVTWHSFLICYAWSLVFHIPLLTIWYLKYNTNIYILHVFDFFHIDPVRKVTTQWP